MIYVRDRYCVYMTVVLQVVVLSSSCLSQWVKKQHKGCHSCVSVNMVTFGAFGTLYGNGVWQARLYSDLKIWEMQMECVSITKSDNRITAR